jgi:hypothetical protein
MMSEPSRASFQAIRPEAAFAAAQNGAACWSRAFSHLTEGFMAAAKAQAAMASEVFKVEPNGWLKPITPDNASGITHEWLARNKARQDALLHGIRQINDDLSACFFAVADDLADGLNFENGKSEAPAAVAKPASSKAASPAEKKDVAA